MHQNSKVPRNCANQNDTNRCQWLFNADRVTDGSVVGVLGQQHMINRSLSFSFTPSLSLLLALSSLFLPCLFLLSLHWYRTHLYSVCFRELQIQLNKQFGSRSLRAVGNPFFFSLRSSVVIKGSPL